MSPTRRRLAVDLAAGGAASWALMRAVTPCSPSSAAIARARNMYSPALEPSIAAKRGAGLRLPSSSAQRDVDSEGPLEPVPGTLHPSECDVEPANMVGVRAH